MSSPIADESVIEAARRMLAENMSRKAAKKAALDAKNKEKWDRYSEQLAKSTPHQGGAKRSRRSRGRVFKYR